MQRFGFVAVLVSTLIGGFAGSSLSAQTGDDSDEHLYDQGTSPDTVPQAARTRVFRRADEDVPIPDVLVLKGGAKIEAYFLRAYGESLVFYVKDSEFSYSREILKRKHVASILYEQYLERDPGRSKFVIRRARKQPVKKQSILAGEFRGWQDRYTRWTFTFQSENNKPLAHSEDATEFGRFVLKSEHRVPGGEYSNRTIANGQYYLHAPHTVNNTEWVLALSRIAYSEADSRDRETALLTAPLKDDLLIVEFSENQSRFRLLWSNHSSRALPALPQIEFSREQDRNAPSPTPQSVRRVRLVEKTTAAPKVTLTKTTRFDRRLGSSRRLRSRMGRWGRAPRRWR